MTGSSGKIFISYRRKVSTWQALSIYYALNEVHKRDVWMDRELIAGENWEEKILKVIGSSHHFVVILAPKSLDRCMLKRDNFRKEIEFAIENKKNIVPLFFNFNWSGEEKRLRRNRKWSRLPHSIRDLAKRDGKDINLKEFKEVVGALNSSSLRGTKGVRVKNISKKEGKQILDLVGTSVMETPGSLQTGDKLDDIFSIDYFSNTARYLNFTKKAAGRLAGVLFADLQIVIKFKDKTGLGSAYEVNVTNASEAPITISDIIIHIGKNESVTYSSLESRYIQLGKLLPVKLRYSENMKVVIPLYFISQLLDKKTTHDDVREISIVDSFGSEFMYSKLGEFLGTTKR